MEDLVVESTYDFNMLIPTFHAELKNFENSNGICTRLYLNTS